MTYQQHLLKRTPDEEWDTEEGNFALLYRLKAIDKGLFPELKPFVEIEIILDEDGEIVDTIRHIVPKFDPPPLRSRLIEEFSHEA